MSIVRREGLGKAAAGRSSAWTQPTRGDIAKTGAAPHPPFDLAVMGQRFAEGDLESLVAFYADRAEVEFDGPGPRRRLTGPSEFARASSASEPPAWSTSCGSRLSVTQVPT
jgi:hypothetical protein